MDDLPTDVAELQRRLQTARTEYAKMRARDRDREAELQRVVGQRIEWERRAIVAETAVSHTLAILRCDPEPGELEPNDVYFPPPDYPLFLAAIEAVTEGAAAVRYRRLMEDVIESFDGPGAVDEAVEAIRDELRQP